MTEVRDHIDGLAGSGWQDRFIELVSQYEQQVFSLIRLLVDSSSLAEQISRDVFVALFHSRATGLPIDDLEIFLYRKTAELCLQSENSIDERLADSLSVERLISESVSCAVLVAAEDYSETVSATLSRLPMEYRLVFLLHDVRGLDFEKMSRILDLSEQVLRQQLRRARLMLYRWVGGRTETFDSEKRFSAFAVADEAPVV